jgi:hypothetical protein
VEAYRRERERASTNVYSMNIKEEGNDV